jgi:hypothetical protein
MHNDTNNAAVAALAIYRAPNTTFEKKADKRDVVMNTLGLNADEFEDLVSFAGEVGYAEILSMLNGAA